MVSKLEGLREDQVHFSAEFSKSTSMSWVFETFLGKDGLRQGLALTVLKL